MSDKPVFTSFITQGLRAAKEESDRLSAETEKAAQKKAREAAAAEELLQNMVLPLLKAAQDDLLSEGILSEVGNGKDENGSLRQSLRLTSTGKPFPPVITFTAVIDAPVPFLGVQAELQKVSDLRALLRTVGDPVTDPSQQGLINIIGKFLSEAVC